ncbi:MAG TPA: hypothetical protein VFX30_09975 [bacterium]|nr:hypothetical protein [bacterium]
MKKNFIGIIAIAALGGLIASGCTYSKSQMPEIYGGDSQVDSAPTTAPEAKDADTVAGGNEDLITPPSGTPAVETAPSGGAAEEGDTVADGGEESNDDAPTTLSVESVSGPDSKTVYVVFNKPIDPAAIIENDSIQFYGTGDGLMSLKIQGELAAGTNPNVIKFTAKEDFLTSLVHTVKIIGADSEDASKAAVDADHNKLPNEYVRKLLCGGSADGLLTCESSTNTTQPSLAVKSAELLSDHRIIAVTFNKPVDVQAVVQNQSIAFFVSPALFPIPLKGVLFAGLTSSPTYSDTVYFALDASEKEVHVHSTGSGFVFAPYTLKVYGLDSKDASKAVKGASGNAMAVEYEHTFVCSTQADTDEVTYVDDCKVL